MLNRNEVTRIEKTVEAAVLETLKSRLDEMVHGAVHGSLSELVEDEVKKETRRQVQSKEWDEHPIPRAGGRLKHREIRNGVIRPAPGGRCEAVWLELDRLHTKGKATLEAVQKISDKKGWNATNTRIEFYRWRKFHNLNH